MLPGTPECGITPRSLGSISTHHVARVLDEQSLDNIVVAAELLVHLDHLLVAQCKPDPDKPRKRHSGHWPDHSAPHSSFDKLSCTTQCNDCQERPGSFRDPQASVCPGAGCGRRAHTTTLRAPQCCRGAMRAPTALCLGVAVVAGNPSAALKAEGAWYMALVAVREAHSNRFQRHSVLACAPAMWAIWPGHIC